MIKKWKRPKNFDRMNVIELGDGARPVIKDQSKWKSRKATFSSCWMIGWNFCHSNTCSCLVFGIWHLGQYSRLLYLFNSTLSMWVHFSSTCTSNPIWFNLIDETIWCDGTSENQNKQTIFVWFHVSIGNNYSMELQWKQTRRSNNVKHTKCNQCEQFYDKI